MKLRAHFVHSGALAILVLVAAPCVGADSWSFVEPMQTERDGPAAVTACDARIYALGGINKSGLLATVEVYDPSHPDLGWNNVAPMNARRWQLAGATDPKGRIYAIGGSLGRSGRFVTAYVERFDPRESQPRWTFTSSLNKGRRLLGAVIAGDGKIYAIGGIAGIEDDFTVYDTVEVYDPLETDPHWGFVASLNSPRVALAAATDSRGRIYAIGGCHARCDPQDVLDTVEVYDPSDAEPRWRLLPSRLNTARRELAAIGASDGRIYAVAGYDPFGTHLASVEVYDPNDADPRWVYVAPLNTSRDGLAAAAGSDGSVYALGGDLDGVPLRSVEKYAPSGLWSRRERMPACALEVP